MTCKVKQQILFCLAQELFICCLLVRRPNYKCSYKLTVGRNHARASHFLLVSFVLLLTGEKCKRCLNYYLLWTTIYIAVCVHKGMWWQRAPHILPSLKKKFSIGENFASLVVNTRKQKKQKKQRAELILVILGYDLILLRMNHIRNLKCLSVIVCYLEFQSFGESELCFVGLFLR